ncbi:leucine-rich repeat and coiled-coil domain-containing protein 1 isoform X2 [Ambystoma mexicanum]|uniref:leucine-rich repeat and coiled-coil domain-containing protein 1 isoform X2 n=1 Tax=Ambystoma mexicanum TaxID=8296 RepID=UPI0037E7F2B8
MSIGNSLHPWCSACAPVHRMEDGDSGRQELTFMDRHIKSLLEISISSTLHSLNLHCNQITKIEGLGHAWNLQHLDLSSNCITQIEGLASLTQLQTLNLSCNMITIVEGLGKLTALTKLNLSYNRINDLTGFLSLHGSSHAVSHIYLHSNCINNLNHLLECMVGLHNLQNLTLEKTGKGNPVCQVPGYRRGVLQAMPQLNYLDGKNILGESENSAEDLMDLPSLDFLEYFASLKSDPQEGKNAANVPVSTSRINEVLSIYRPHEGSSTLSTLSSRKDTATSSDTETPGSGYADNLHREIRIRKLEDQVAHLLLKPSSSKAGTPLKVMKPKRETDPTSESDCGSGKENQCVSRKTKLPNHRKTPLTSKQRVNQTTKANISDSGQKQGVTKRLKNISSQNKSELSSSMSSVKRKAEDVVAIPRDTPSLKDKGEVESARVPEESTYRALVQELDQERERRWKAEQIVTKLTDHIKELQSQSKEEKDINSMAVYTTDRLKELVLKERNNKNKLQVIIRHLNAEKERLADELKQAIRKEEEQHQAVKNLEDALSKMEAKCLHQQATEMKQIHEAELKTTAAHREVDLLRVSVRQQKEKVQQLHELLTSREQAHRKELDARVTLNGPEFQAALASEIEKGGQRHDLLLNEMQEKINVMKQQYMELEDEFRAALTIEAKRFQEVKDGFENVTTELAEHKTALAQSKQREKQSANLVQELTTMVKEQKTRISEVAKSKEEVVSDLKKRLRALESIADEEKQKALQVELLKKDKAKLISQLMAQESVIDGLRAERKIWGQELAQQGVSLAQDRGRLEAKIEVLTSEVETLKKQNERENDALRIKAKVVEDQTHTIRKLKEALQDGDEQIRKLREENIAAQKTFQEQFGEQSAQLEALTMKLERHNERKGELKQQLEEKDNELEDVKKEYSMMNRKWQDKAALLTHLEAQVKQMKDHFDTKEKKLIEERNKCLQSQKIAVDKLHSVDDAFRRQLESVLASHQAELLQLTNEKQKQIEAANEKVYQVEEEMRLLLRETANCKKAMEEKTRRLTNALSDIQQDL